MEDRGTSVLGFQENYVQTQSAVYLVIRKNNFCKLYFLLSRDYWISLICLAMAKIWGKDTY